MPTVRRIAREAKGSDYRISSFIKGIVGSPAFQMTTVAEPVETEVQ
jgi:hypothetical protein